MRHLLLAFGLTVAAPVSAQDLPAAQALTTAELSAQTGGLRTPFGVDIGFGAVVKTYVDGNLALETQLTWTKQGAVQTTVSGMPDSDLAQQAAGGGIHLDGAAATGLFLPGDNGGTAVLHNLDNGNVASFVFNTADNRNIRQDTAITLAIPGLDQLQKDFAGQQTAARLSDSVGRAMGAGN